MSYRTLEEKFLADYEQLERERDELQAKVDELQERFEDKRKDLVLDAAVRAAGRAKVLEDSFVSWRTYDAKGREFETWVQLMTENNLPKGVSLNEFISYFEHELYERYEEQYAKDYAKED